ncbi:MAG: DnaJ domain-containing protein [Deltaproteobacteria bacterium]|jgi:DnaJ like chaperone protein|nr:DnaJ domain-containing protein [Deltaproteobacteria bacterium]
MIKVLLVVLGLAYLVSPYDLFPDFFVGVGWLDDLVLLGLLWWYLYVYRKRGQYGQQRERPGADQHGARSSGDSSGRTHSKEEKPAYTGQKDPYAILNVSRQASQTEIREAYLQLANQYHPDKVLHLGEEFRELAEHRFKEIQSAYEALKFK